MHVLETESGVKWPFEFFQISGQKMKNKQLISRLVRENLSRHFKENSSFATGTSKIGTVFSPFNLREIIRKQKTFENVVDS